MDKSKISVSFFFRKPAPFKHSIEGLFQSIQQKLPSDIVAVNEFAPVDSEGLLQRVQIANAARKSQNDVNHITGDIHFIALALQSDKTVLTIHDIAPLLTKKGLRRAMIKYFWFSLPMKKAGYITVISEFTKQQLLEHTHADESKIRVIYDCISPVFLYSPSHFNTEMPTILHIGTKENKNLARLIEALSQVRCKLVIVGPLSVAMRTLLQEHHIYYENHVDVSVNQLVIMYKHADIVAFVSLYEGFGLPIPEAQATGRVVITSNRGAMREIAGDSALLVDPERVEDIRNGIKRLVADHDYREELIRKGLQNSRRFTPAAVAADYALLYREIKAKSTE